MLVTINNFINESYLKGGRHLLYHFTRSTYIKSILKDDTLKISRTADDEQAICFTRSSYFQDHSSSIRIVLDSDLLKRYNYTAVPYDEIIKTISKDGTKISDFDEFKGYSKSNPKSYGRKTTHKISLKQDGFGHMKGYGDLDGLEWEYEERVYKDIKNLGKCVVYLDLTERELNDNLELVKTYLDKYPHIEIVLFELDKLYDRRNIIDFKEYYEKNSIKRK